MRLGPFTIAFREPVKPAPALAPSQLERLEALEDAVVQLKDEFESVLDRINRWSARQAAQKRVQATKQLEAMSEPAEPEIVAAEVTQSPPDPDALSPTRRRELKAALRRRALGG